MSSLGHQNRRRISSKFGGKTETKISLSMILQNVCQIISLKNEIKTIKKETNELKIKSRNIMKKKNLLLYHNPKYLLLKNLVDNETKLLNEQKKNVNKIKLNLIKSCKEIKRQTSLNKIWDKKFIQNYEAYNKDRQQLQILERKLQLRQHKMCRQLLHIFPFREINIISNDNNKLKTSKFEIRYMSIPNNFDKLMNVVNQGGIEEEKMAIGLGYIAHLCTLLSRYLQVPLRHPIICRGSRSKIVGVFEEAEEYQAIRENRRTKIKPEYPLYSKNEDKQRFKYGLELLKGNISQLALYVNIHHYKSNSFIHNIRNVLYTMALARF